MKIEFIKPLGVLIKFRTLLGKKDSTTPIGFFHTKDLSKYGLKKK